MSSNTRTALVVDDTAVNRALACAMLKRLGWATDQASGGAEALQKLATNRYDIVLLDVSMPMMSGQEVCARIRAMPELAGLRVVAYTAHAMPEERAGLLAAGFDDLLIKPIDSSALAAVLPA